MPAFIAFAADAIFDALAIGGSIIGAEIAYGVIYATISIAATLALGAAAKALAGKKAGAAGGPQSRDVTLKGTIEPRQVMYGQARTGGVIVYYGLGGTNGEWLYFVVALAGHQCDAIADVWLDSRVIKSAEIDPSTGVVASTASGGSFWNGGNPTLWIYKHLGASAQAVDAQMNTFIPEWDSTHRGAGVAYIVVKMQHNEPAYPSGAPSSVYSLVNGRRLYDPRLDSTNGGSGTQRVTDATTWTYSNNWALAVRDYLSGGSIWYDVATPKALLTINELNSRIDDSFVITAANHADEAITVPIPLLAGTNIWTNGSKNVVGTTTQFTYQLVAGEFLLGPDNNFYKIATITDDTHLVLTANFTGTTTASGVTTQFNTVASSTVTQPRYTCDTQLSCGDSHASNMTDLLSGGIGHLSYAKGKYRIYAGVYDAPSISIGADDIVGAVEVATHPQGEDLYNLVQGNFYDELRGWTAQGFPAQQSASYQSDDGGIFPRNITLPVTRTSFRAQRIANCLLQQSRNKITVTLSNVGPAAMNIAEWETFNLTIPEYGWNPLILRCLTWKWLGTGFISLTARVETSAAYADLALANYQILAGNSYPAISQKLPDPPRGLIATTIYGGIAFFVTPPTIFTQSSVYQLWESASSSPFSSATMIQEYPGNTFTLSKTDGIPRYYWVTVRDRTDNVSTQFPVSVGLQAFAGMPGFTLSAIGAAVVSGTTAQSTGATSAWDTHKFQSVQSYVGGVFVSAQVNPSTGDLGIGLTNTPAGANTSGTTNYTAGWLALGGGPTCAIVFNGAIVLGGLAAPSTSDVFVIFFDGFWWKWLRNSAVVFQIYSPNAGTPFFLFGDINEPALQWNNIAFGPVTNSTPNPFIATGNAVTHDSTVQKIGGSGAWDSGCYSINGYAICHVQGRLVNAAQNVSFGLCLNPTASKSFTNLNWSWAWGPGASSWFIEESGAAISGPFPGRITDLPWIDYTSGGNVRYWLNGVLMRTIAASGSQAFGQFCIFDPGSGMNAISFGPNLAIDLVPTASIDPNAATTLFIGYSGSGDTFSVPAATTTQSSTAMSPGGPNYDCTAIVTVTAINVQRTSGAGPVYLVIKWDDAGSGVMVQSPDQNPLPAVSTSMTVQAQFAHLGANAGLSALHVAYHNAGGAAAGINCDAYTVQVEFVIR